MSIKKSPRLRLVPKQKTAKRPGRKPHEDILTEHQGLAIPLVVAGMTNRGIAKTLGVGERCVARWKSQSHISLEIQKLQGQVQDAAREALLRLVPLAIHTLERMTIEGIQNDDKKPGSKEALQSATKILAICGYGDRFDGRIEFAQVDPDESFL